MTRETKDRYYNYRLKKERGKAGLRGRDVAEKLRVNPTCYSHWERLRSCPNSKTALEIARMFKERLDVDMSAEDYAKYLFPDWIDGLVKELKIERGEKDSKDALDYTVPLSGGIQRRMSYIPKGNNEELNGKINESLGFLSHKEREIIKLRYGFGGEVYTLEEVGHVFKITRERVRQLEVRAMNKLRDYFRELEMLE